MNPNYSPAPPPSDQRKQDRYRLLRQPDALVYVRTGWARSAAMAIKDVSSAGVSLYLERALPVASRVSIEYAAPSMMMNVNGVVVWCRTRQDSDTDAGEGLRAWVLGIELFSPMMLLSAFRDALPVHALTMAGG